MPAPDKNNCSRSSRRPGRRQRNRCTSTSSPSSSNVDQTMPNSVRSSLVAVSTVASSSTIVPSTTMALSVLTDTQSVMWDTSTHANSSGLHTEVPSPTSTSNTRRVNPSMNATSLPHSAYYGLGLGVLLLLALVLAAIIVALVFILKKRQRQSVVKTPGGSISTRNSTMPNPSQTQFEIYTEQEPVYHEINDMPKDSSNHDKTKNKANDGYAVLMDDSSITYVQVDELNIDEKFSEHPRNEMNGSTLSLEHDFSHYAVLEPSTSNQSTIHHALERDFSFSVVEQLSSPTQSGIYHTLEPDTLQ